MSVAVTVLVAEMVTMGFVSADETSLASAAIKTSKGRVRTLMF